MNSNSGNDNVFLSRLTAIVEANLGDENFGVTELAQIMGMSRSRLYFRVKSGTQKTVSQFIREIRLNKALELLRQSSLTVSEISYQVGFGSPAYFNKCFHEYFGYTPGEVKKLGSEEVLSEGDLTNNTTSKGGHIKVTILKIVPFLVFIFLLSWIGYNKVLNHQADKLSIIVLPFNNLSNDPANEYFADGIREDILNNLYRISSLRVLSNTTAENFRDTKLTAREIAHLMHVEYVLEGSVRRYDDDVRISVQLIDAKKDDHLWSDNFDRNMKDIIPVQSEIALLVANKLKAVLPQKEIRKIEQQSTRNSEAYDYYLQARFLLHRANSPQRSGFDAAGVISSVQYYKKAIEADSAFADAYAGLANATTQLTAWGIARDTGMVRKVYQLCQKAIQLDPNCAEAHTILGLNYWFRHDFERSGDELRRSIELNPNFATARQWYAQHLMITGPISEARNQIDKALELEPYFWVVKSLDSWIAYFEKDYQKSLEISEVAGDFNPNFPMNAWLHFLNYVKLNEGEKAHQQIREIARKYSHSDNYSDEIDQAFEERGIDGLFISMIDINNNHPVPVEGLNGSPFYTAWWYAVLEDREETLSWLEKTLHSKYIPYHYFNLILFHPDFEFLHEEPRFRAVTDSLGLSLYWVNVTD
ncbi:helix-turn-helix domain-containing protein [Maribellus sediminis]|uniref:helix-turn-helix domain-containing protein n=1 Tax=Maribellus sediminis TaxID=2696285 RepID=UPI0014314DFA|nr:helix-turn-helix domain-containing protein [Maribellus sediminis]